MKKEFEKRDDLIGLEEINQVETSEVNGGLFSKNDFIFCYVDIPPMTDIFEITLIL